MSDSSTTDPDPVEISTESKPLHEKLLPQTSIRFFMGLIAVSAFVMLIFQSAADGFGWARIVSLLISTTAGCFIAYAGLFLAGSLFSATTAPIVDALDSVNEPAECSRSDVDGREKS